MKPNTLALTTLAAVGAAQHATAQMQGRPNVVIVIADDMGYGDVSAYGSSTIRTPNIDRLANEGVCFTDGHATSATSTPSRYGLFTGMYPWKNENAKILPGDAPLIIGTEQFTMPKMFQHVGYETAAIGKWHLGMGVGKIDWNRPISPSGNAVGFDYTCLIAATVDRVPTVYVENGRVVGLTDDDPLFVDYENNFEGEPTALTNPELVKTQWSHGHHDTVVNGIPRIGFMKGGKSAYWKDDEMAEYFLNRVDSFINADRDRPFFLYYGLHEPHVPRTPATQFAGSTRLGPRGDVLAEADWCVGQLMKKLEEAGVAENTIVIFSSDNRRRCTCYGIHARPQRRTARWEIQPLRCRYTSADVRLLEGTHTPCGEQQPGIAAGPAGFVCSNARTTYTKHPRLGGNDGHLPGKEQARAQGYDSGSQRTTDDTRCTRVEAQD